MLWGSINALQIIVCLSYSSVPWNAVLGFVFDWLTKITSFDLLNPFGPIPLTDEKNFYEWNWSSTDCKGNNLCIANGGSLTFLPNLGSIALFLHLALFTTLLSPLASMLTAIGINGKWNVVQRFAKDPVDLSNNWIRVLLETFITLYMFGILGFEMNR